MSRGRGPSGRRADNCGRRHRNVLPPGETPGRTVTREVRAVVVGGILLFICREVTKVRLHRGDIRLVLRVRKLRNRNRGKNADDDDHDQKLNKSKTLLVARHFYLLKRLDRRQWLGTLYQNDQPNYTQVITPGVVTPES